MNIFKLVGSVFVDTSDANKNLDNTSKKADKTGTSFANIAKKAGKMAIAAGTAVASVAAGAVKMATKTADAADEIDKMSTRLGISRKAYQELDYAMGQAGVDVNSMQTGMKSLLKNMDAVTEGNAKAIDKFEKLGVSVTDANGNMRSQEEVLYDVISAFQSMEDSSEKNRLAQELLGKQGQELLPLLNSEAGSFENLTQKANDLGLVMSDDVIDAGVDMKDNLDTVTKSLAAMGAKIGAKVLPMINEFLTWVQDHMPEIEEFFDSAGAVVDSVFDGMKKAWDEVLYPVLSAFWSYVSETLYPKLKEVFEESLVPMVETAFKGIKRIWRTVLQPILEAIAPAAELAASAIMIAFQFVADNIGPVIDTIADLLEPLATLITGIVEGLKWINDKAGDLTKSGKEWLNDEDNTAAKNAKDMAKKLGIPGMASGGTVDSGGLTWVGERGPELLNLPSGSTVTNNNDSNEIIYLLKQILMKNTTIELDGREMGRLVKSFA